MQSANSTEHPVSPYYDTDLVNDTIGNEDHRALIGGLWDTLGDWQLDLMKSVGLQPEHSFVDVGCGCFRGGVKFIEYLDETRYFGIDLQRSLIDAGVEKELKPLGLDTKVPEANLAAVSDFDIAGFGQTFDFGIALSVFTHLPLNTIRIAFERLSETFAVGGKFVFTYFPYPNERPTYLSLSHTNSEITTFGDRDPYHYRYSDLEYVAGSLPWQLRPIEFERHPRGQFPVLATRL